MNALQRLEDQIARRLDADYRWVLAYKSLGIDTELLDGMIHQCPCGAGVIQFIGRHVDGGGWIHGPHTLSPAEGVAHLTNTSYINALNSLAEQVPPRLALARKAA